MSPSPFLLNPILLTCTVLCDSSHTRIALDGEIDVATVWQVEEALAAPVAAGTDVIVDLGGVTFVDSAGLRCLLEARTAAARTGGKVRIVGCPARVLRLLTLTGLDKVLFDDHDILPR